MVRDRRGEFIEEQYAIYQGNDSSVGEDGGASPSFT
jgi:hypothetical protein